MKIRVYFEDTDAQKVVYYANYLKFTARARSEFFRELDYNHGKVYHDTNCGFVIRHCEIDYKASAIIDDLLDVYTKVTEVKGTSLIMEQRICRDGEELVTVKTVLVHIDENFKPSRVPEEIRSKLS